MATTDRAGLRVDCLSALARGGAGMAVGAMAGMGAAVWAMVEASTVDAVSWVGVALLADADLPVAVGLQADAESWVAADLRAARLVGSTVARFVAVAGSTAAVVFMAEAADTRAVADTAVADTGKLLRSLILKNVGLQRQRRSGKTAGSQELPAVSFVVRV
jgi:hypothetical protein